ncbi:MAG: hypothetical protein ACTHMP_16965, partial [Thermomicrobiales bacterium]
MQPNLEHYCTYAICEQLDLMLPTYRTELGNAQTVTVSRQYSEQPTAPPPEIWVDTTIPPGESYALIGDDVGVDSSGNWLYGRVFDSIGVDLGIRAMKTPECDNLLDFINTLRWSVNPATNVRWVQEFYQRRGIEVLDFGKVGSLRQTRSSQFGGVLYEMPCRMAVRTSVAENVIYEFLNSITVLPTADI